ncbi:hypothetical protein JMJ77_0010026 [Colletotrichum scovillei]|uniref:Uncharacterized protein n=1 Tax=Colletotrichum scovillei TaxID=1209932 RepID=A0A9P7QQV5_9PEZI|nr:hypothetical protein JMJ78_0001098 [Colletotrichum scovillei]KAG7040922.1 hypothetical protein JMJ77_0010026 [Colletotrichum scovillei]
MTQGVPTFTEVGIAILGFVSGIVTILVFLLAGYLVWRRRRRRRRQRETEPGPEVLDLRAYQGPTHNDGKLG